MGVYTSVEKANEAWEVWAANINMKGKKSKADHCWCCVCIDMREKIRDEEHHKEMRDRGEE